MPMLSIVIQAGGQSQRMGQDKALVPFLGQPLILRVLGRVAEMADELLVTANQPEKYAFLGLTPIPDILPGCGALGGLYTALSAAHHPLVAVIACDMPFVNPQLIAVEMALLNQTGADVAIVHTATGLEPFHAVYRRETCLPQVLAALEAGKRRVDAWFSQVNLVTIPEDSLQRLDPQGLTFMNANTPAELAAAEKQAQVYDAAEQARNQPGPGCV